MTVADALRVADTLRPEAVDSGLKRRWLCELEGRICAEITGQRPAPALALAEELPLAMRLSVPAPYDRLYWAYLVAMSDLAAMDTAAYTVSQALFREAYDAYARWYQRTKGGRM